MQKHGVRCESYQVDESFQATEEVLVSAIQKYNPQIVIVFHAVGIINKLLNESVNWIQTLPPETILIEDSVHSIVNSNEIVIRKKNHFVVDSWRKVMPLQGSALYGRIDDMQDVPQLLHRASLYTFSILLLWLVMQATLWVQSKTQGTVSRFAGRIAEMSMIAGYNLIGNSSRAHSTPAHFISLYDKINHEKMIQIKERQVALYDKQLSQVFAQTDDLFPIWRRNSDDGRMRGYPIGLRLPQAHHILKSIRKQGVFVRFELSDSQWSKDKKVIFLPLGPHLTDTQIYSVCEIFTLLQCPHEQGLIPGGISECLHTA